VTRLSPEEKCAVCGSVLVPPELAPETRAPSSADYVCLNCGRPYGWTKDNLPRLSLIVVAQRRDTEGE